MTTTDTEVRAYLAELRRALAGRDDREAVLDDVRQHIDDALAEGASPTQVLEDLGDPLAIAAESGVPAAPQPPRFLDTRGGSVLVVLLLAFGGLVVPVLGWIAGVVLLSLSGGWRTVDKVLGAVAPAIGFGLLVGGAVLLPGGVPVHGAILFGPVLGAIAAGVYLLLRSRPRP